MVLFHYMIEVLDLTDHHSYFHVGVDLVNRRFVRATFIHRDFFRCAVRRNGLVEKPLGCGLVSLGSQKKINRFPFLVYGVVKVLPFAVDLHVRLIHPPASTNRALVLSEYLFQYR